MRPIALPVALIVLVLMVGCGREAAAPAAVPPPADAPATAAAPEAGAVATPATPLPGRPSPLQPQALELGAVLDADGRVAAARTVFRAGDSVHVSVPTLGASAASMLRVQWSDANDAVLHRDERAVSTAGPAVHTFSLTPGPGWPPGNYRVTVIADGQPAGVREFEWR